MIPALGDKVGDLPQPEHGYGNAHQPQCHEGAVHPRIFHGGGQRAHGDGNRHPDKGGPADQTGGDGGGLHDFGHHHFPPVGIGCQIAGNEQLFHHGHVLNRQRAIKPVFPPYVFHDLRGGVAPCNTGGGVRARCGEKDKEHQGRDTKQHENRLPSAA